MPDASIADLPAQIALALSIASSSTGADYHYLVNTARTESSFQADAKAPTSSAEGLFQFIEETWIRTIKDLGAPYGLGKYADMITKTPAGRYNVDTSEHRAAILKLRKDPMVSAKMAAAYARQNEDFVRNAIGRTPTSDELYIAHFLGPADAVRLITYRDATPSFSAPELFPAAAKANRPIFFSDAGPRSVAQVYDLLASRQRGFPAPDDGAFFAAGIDFGSWSPTVEKVYTTRVKAGDAKLASATGFSLLDALSGQDDSLSTKTPAKMKTDSGWGAVVDSAVQAPGLITVAADYPQTEAAMLDGADQPATFSEPAAQPLARVAAMVPEAPRLKVIHVPQE